MTSGGGTVKAGAEVIGTAKVQMNIDRAIANILKRADQAYQGAGIDTQADAKINCPVDTGRLRASIQYKRLGPCQYTVGTSVWYSIDVELGHKTKGGGYVKAHPYLFPAYAKGKRQLRTELAAIPGVKIVRWS